MIQPEVQDAITSGIATVAGLPQEQTEAALQVLSGVAKLAKSYYNPDGSISSVAPNQRKYYPGKYNEPEEKDSSWFPWYKSPLSWFSGKSHGSHGQGHGQSHGGHHEHHPHSHSGGYGFDVHHGGNQGAHSSKQLEGHAAAFNVHQTAAAQGLQAQHVSAAQAAHAQEHKGAAATEHHTSWAKKGGVDLGFDYGFHFDRKKAATAEHSGESAWNCSEQAASIIRKFSAFDVCGFFTTDKRAALGADHGHHAEYEQDAHGSHHWAAEHGHGI